jgi:hypothetical protein
MGVAEVDMRRTFIGWPALAGAGLLVLTACGGGRDVGSAGSPTAGAGPTTTTLAPMHPPAPGVPGTPGPGAVPTPAPIPPGRPPGGP